MLPKLSNIIEPILILIISELESIISPIHIPSIDENQDSISSYQHELDQNQILDILTSYPFPEIELKDECEPKLV